MLMLIAEIFLTVAAWRKGWKGWALIPIAVAGSVGFFAGAILGALGLDFMSVAPYFMLLDICAIIALIVLASKDRYEKEPSLRQMMSQPSVEEEKPVGARRALSTYGGDQVH